MQGQESVAGLRQLGQILAGAPADPGTDWAALAHLARRRSVSALLLWQLGQGQGRPQMGYDVPGEVMDALREDLYTAVARGALAERQLATVLSALSSAGVPTLVVKGTVLGTYYPDPALRLYSDIDIMVPREQVEAAARALNGLGYRCLASKGWSLDRLHHLPPMASDSGAFLVELHWRLDYEEEKGRLPAEDLWSRAVPWTVRGRTALRLDAVDDALYVCRHAVVQHKVRGAFRSLVDLAWMVEGWGAEEWEALVQRTLYYGLERPVYLMLFLTAEMLDLAVPAGVMSVLTPSGPLLAPEELVHRLMGVGSAASTHVSAGAVQAVVEGSLWTQVRHLLQHLILPRDGMAMVYGIPANSPLIWLAYLWRPLDLIGRYGRTALRALGGEQEAQSAWQREVWLERWLRGEARE